MCRCVEPKETDMTDVQTPEGSPISTAASKNPEKQKKTSSTKAETILTLLRSKRGASIEQLQQASGWQAHSVRGFLSGTVRKKLGLTLVTETGKDSLRRYRIEKSAAAE